ncbi:MAG: putative Ig domain-containing protein, partial [Chloroflexi bacterium]|nr:putative Ig domain-containing protein [Chloroflexota bacterium]
QDGPVAEFASRACRPGRAPAYIIGQQAQTAHRASSRCGRWLTALGAVWGAAAIAAIAASGAPAGAAPAPAAAAAEANPNAPAEFTITSTVLRPRDKVMPLGANTWGRCGAVEWAANNFVRNPGNEPIYWRNLHRARNVGPNWLEIDGPGTSWYDLWASGFLSGADLRIYRLVDKDGKPLPPNAKGDNLDTAAADHAIFVGKARIIPEGSPGFPDGGWVATRYAVVYPNNMVRHGNLSATDTSGVQNGRTYWYAVAAVSADGQESEISNEASAGPAAGLDTPPHLLIFKDDDQAPALKAGSPFEFAPKVCGGQAPLRWECVDGQGRPAALPEGLKMDAATGTISGRAKADAEDLRLCVKVTDAKGRSDGRVYVINPRSPGGAAPAPSKSAPPPAKAAKGKAQPAAPVSINIPECKLELKVSDTEIKKRLSKLPDYKSKIKTGYLRRYIESVGSASSGAVFAK